MGGKRKVYFTRITMNVTRQQHEQLKKEFSASTCRSLNIYLRKRVFEGRVTVAYRNKSMDDFLTEAMRLRKLLEDAWTIGLFDPASRERYLVVMAKIKEQINQIADHVLKNKFQ